MSSNATVRNKELAPDSICLTPNRSKSDSACPSTVAIGWWQWKILLIGWHLSKFRYYLKVSRTGTTRSLDGACMAFVWIGWWQYNFTAVQRLSNVNGKCAGTIQAPSDEKLLSGNQAMPVSAPILFGGSQPACMYLIPHLVNFACNHLNSTLIV